jgi:hypothetical protein
MLLSKPNKSVKTVYSQRLPWKCSYLIEATRIDASRQFLAAPPKWLKSPLPWPRLTRLQIVPCRANYLDSGPLQNGFLEQFQQSGFHIVDKLFGLNISRFLTPTLAPSVVVFSVFCARKQLTQLVPCCM